MLALLATHAPASSVGIVAAIEVIWLVQNEIRQHSPRRISPAARPVVTNPSACISFIGSAPDLVLTYQLPPPELSFAS
jgi:hypothetical protein